ncbi:hypothetical protein ONZ51_g10645 [Trametes cubensis]|uniref:Uncharacterized protein n=1 Tax=Trametes cubensis TaxID=1111947 RepID=A0AAD7TK53_9APHY|nr:hypothetical protein ONZ51_g10645 [Trametes cubensis]
MARPEFVQNGLKTILENISSLEQRFFEATPTRPRHSFTLEGGVEVTFAKEGYTRSGASNIHYSILFENVVTDVLNIHLRNPSTDDPTVNTRAVRIAIEYLLSTGSTILSRDVYVDKLLEA